MAASERAIIDVDVLPSEQLAPVVLLFERLAGNKDIDVAKLERLIAMQEHILAHEAKAAFNRAFAEMQAEIPAIRESSSGDGGKWTFAPLEDIQQVVRPILVKYGFGLSFRTEWPDKGTIKVIGILTHRDGHERTSEFLADADTSGSKNAIQARGSAVSYGHRYTTKDLLNITTKGADDDGKRAIPGGPTQHPSVPPVVTAGVTPVWAAETPATPTQHPSGYLAWLDTMRATAQTGMPALSRAWNEAPLALRTHLTATNLKLWTELRAIATRTIAPTGRAS